MRKLQLSTKLFLLSVIIFTGCSNTKPTADKKLAKESASIYSIMGITKEDSNTPIFRVQNNDHQNEYHFRVARTTPVYQNSYNNYQSSNYEEYSEEPTIEVVSYGSMNSYNQVEQVPPYRATNSIINKVEKNAKKFLGTRYVWGATGPNKFDCSGFTQWVFRDVGIKIPRVSRDQAKVGQYVSFNNLKKGDMIFFDTKKKKTGRVTHVGIYLGNGNFIHASSAAKKVVIYNFNDKPYYKKRFLWGRRVIRDNIHYASNY